MEIVPGNLYRMRQRPLSTTAGSGASVLLAPGDLVLVTETSVVDIDFNDFTYNCHVTALWGSETVWIWASERYLELVEG